MFEKYVSKIIDGEELLKRGSDLVQKVLSHFNFRSDDYHKHIFKRSKIDTFEEYENEW